MEVIDIYFQGGTIRGSINLPAQTLYPTIPTIYSLLSQSPVKEVVWYCGLLSTITSFRKERYNMLTGIRFIEGPWSAGRELVCRLH